MAAFTRNESLEFFDNFIRSPIMFFDQEGNNTLLSVRETAKIAETSAYKLRERVLADCSNAKTGQMPQYHLQLQRLHTLIGRITLAMQVLQEREDHLTDGQREEIEKLRGISIQLQRCLQS